MHWNNHRLHAKDDVRALFILLQCPLFSTPTTYSVYSHLLRQILGLSNGDHHLFVHWLKTWVILGCGSCSNIHCFHPSCLAVGRFTLGSLLRWLLLRLGNGSVRRICLWCWEDWIEVWDEKSPFCLPNESRAKSPLFELKSNRAFHPSQQDMEKENSGDGTLLDV